MGARNPRPAFASHAGKLIASAAMVGSLALAAVLLQSVSSPPPAAPAPEGPPPMHADRDWEVLTATASPRQQLAEAGRRLGPGRLELAGVWIDGPALAKVATASASEPLTRVVREWFGRPIDLPDFLLFLDDLIADDRDLVAAPAFLPAGRARAVGVLLHPNDVFRNQPRRYGEAATVFPLDEPQPQLGLVPPADGALVGPDWAARYQQPQTQEGRMKALDEANPDFSGRVRTLIAQLRAQGAMVFVEATVRPRERGYLLYGSFILSRSDNEARVIQRVNELREINEAWGLKVPIEWMHPQGWEATKEAARQLAETYGVVYATRRGARSSDHYDGSAIDLFVVDLPRTVRLTAPDGAQRTFDLSAPEESRDLSLTPALIDWVEDHFSVRKLRKDYPHWTDAAQRHEDAARP